MKLHANIRRDSRYYDQRTRAPFPVFLRSTTTGRPGFCVWIGGPGGQYHTSDLDFHERTAQGSYTPVNFLSGDEPTLIDTLIGAVMASDNPDYLRRAVNIMEQGCLLVSQRATNLEIKRIRHRQQSQKLSVLQ